MKIIQIYKTVLNIQRNLWQIQKNTEILVLDEATSSLDNRTEEIIQETIKNLKNKMTVISIAHRFSTIKNCDCIFLLENGIVKEKGTFENLSINSKSFQKLANLPKIS